MLSQERRQDQRRSWPARPAVRRRQTLPSIPATPSDDEQTKQGPTQHAGGGGSTQQLRDRQSRNTSSSSSTTAPETQDVSSAAGTRGRRLLGVRLSGDGQSSHAIASVSGTRGPHRRLGRTPSSPSVLLSKVKERIREKVSHHCNAIVYTTVTQWRFYIGARGHRPPKFCPGPVQKFFEIN